MSDRDKLEVGSKFWNEGKWENFVLPFLKEPGVLVDMGCNSGLFLKLAEDMGYTAIGVDSDNEAVKRGIAWRDKNGGKYKIIHKRLEDCIDELPVADYTIFVNSHYYTKVEDWMDYLDKLQYKTRYCIIVTTEKRARNRCWTKSDLGDVRGYFKTWEEVGFIDELPLEGNYPRKLWGLCFKSPHIERVPVKELDCGNHVQDGFYKEIDKGTDYRKTRYYKILKPYRKRWSEKQLNSWVEDRIKVYKDLKENGLKKPLLVDSQNLILDGNHRYSMTVSLGHDSVFIRRV